MPYLPLDDSKQDSDCVLALIRRSLELYARGFPQVNECFIRSDNGNLVFIISTKEFLGYVK